MSWVGVLCLIVVMSVGHSGLADEKGSRSSRSDCSCNITQQLKQILELSDDQEKMTQQIQTQANQITAAQDRQRELLNSVRKLESAMKGKVVAFCVTTPTGQLTRPGNRPLFNTTLVNTGSYDKSTGIFTCPVAGIYSFSLNIQLDEFSNQGDVQCYFMVNGLQKGHVHSHYDLFDTTSGTIVVSLNVHDKMHVDCFDWQYVRRGYEGTSFMGVLITPN